MANDVPDSRGRAGRAVPGPRGVADRVPIGGTTKPRATRSRSASVGQGHEARARACRTSGRRRRRRPARHRTGAQAPTSPSDSRTPQAEANCCRRAEASCRWTVLPASCSARTAGGSRPQATTGPRGCGTPPPSARVWDVATGAELTRIEHTHKVRRVAFSPDGQLVVTAGRDRDAKAWDAATGANRFRLTHPDFVLGVAFSPDGHRIATASRDGTEWVWESGGISQAR
jgi:hypothetical protein